MKWMAGVVYSQMKFWHKVFGFMKATFRVGYHPCLWIVQSLEIDKNGRCGTITLNEQFVMLNGLDFWKKNKRYQK